MSTAPEPIPARIVAHHRGAYVAATTTEERWAELSGRFRHDHPGPSELPVVGDRVLLRAHDDRWLVEQVQPRTSAISRNAAGSRTDRQILAANVDVVFLAVATNLDRFASRVERYLIAAWDSGAQPVIVLTKADLCADAQEIVDALAVVSVGVPIVVSSTLEEQGIEELHAHLLPDRIGVLLGPSGVGKSSLVNALAAGTVREVRAIRPGDHRGRHTTTGRALLELPGGGAIIDTPGLRELQLWDDEGVDRAFTDISEMLARCRFSDCAHDTEPGCAIRAALEDGTLDAERYRRYERLRREAAAQRLRRDARARIEARRTWIRRAADGDRRRQLKGHPS